MSSDTLRQRAEIEAVIAGRTLCDELRDAAGTWGDAPAYADEVETGAGADPGAGWRSLTWSQARQRVLEAAAAWARGVDAGSLAALASDPRVLDEAAAGVAAANGRLAPGAAGETVAPAAGGVDRGDRRAHPHAQA